MTTMINEAKGIWELISNMHMSRFGRLVIVSGIAFGLGAFIPYKLYRIEAENSLKKDEERIEIRKEIDLWREAYIKSDEGCLERLKTLHAFYRMVQEENERTRQEIIDTRNRANRVLDEQREVLSGLKNIIEE